MAGYPPPAGFNLNSGPNYPPAGAPGYPPQGGMGYPPSGGAGYPPQGGPPPPGSGYGAPQQPPYGGPPAGGGYGGPGYGAPPGSGYGAPAPMGSGFGGQPPAGGPGYGAPPVGGPGYGAPPAGGPGYGAPPGGQPGYGAPPGGYGAPPAGGPGYGAPQASGGYGAGYGAPGGGYYSGRPTVVPAPHFDPGKDAEALRKAMRGFGTRENEIIDVLAKRTSAQRAQISAKFTASFGKSLEKELKSELSGKFEDVVLLSIMDLPTMLATGLYDAMEGAGTKEIALIQILVPFSNQIVRQTVAAYQQVLQKKKKSSKRNLESDIRGDTSGDFEKVLICLMQGGRDEHGAVDMGRAQQQAEELYRAGEKRMGTEEAVFTRILSQSSFAQIKAISGCYQQKYGKSLVKAIKKETSGYYEKTLVAIAEFAEDKNAMLAEWLYESMVGMGTRDEQLIRLVLSRSEIDLQDIKEAYSRKYGKSLAKAIQGDTSGDYKKMLLALVGQ